MIDIQHDSCAKTSAITAETVTLNFDGTSFARVTLTFHYCGGTKSGSAVTGTTG